MTEKERTWLRAYAGQNKLVVTGEDSTCLGDEANLIRIAKCTGKDYTASLQKNFEGSTPDQEHEFLESHGADVQHHRFFLPFLGEVQGAAGPIGVTFKLPAIEKGAVFWYEP